MELQSGPATASPDTSIEFVGSTSSSTRENMTSDSTSWVYSTNMAWPCPPSPRIAVGGNDKHNSSCGGGSNSSGPSSMPHGNVATNTINNDQPDDEGGRVAFLALHKSHFVRIGNTSTLCCSAINI